MPEILRYSDEALVVRIGKQVFSIPRSDLDTYENERLEALGREALDRLFAAYHDDPKVDAVLVPTVYVHGGG
jgi:hypothetical protein